MMLHILSVTESFSRKGKETDKILLKNHRHNSLKKVKYKKTMMTNQFAVMVFLHE